MAWPGASDHEGVAVASAAAKTKTVYAIETHADRDYTPESTLGHAYFQPAVLTAPSGRNIAALIPCAPYGCQTLNELSEVYTLFLVLLGNCSRFYVCYVALRLPNLVQELYGI
ncbi:MAG TPA: hypothetical protein VHZ55_35005 [Bryobacteraceae bacterium]|nr:hypothetical protein [Bryobacteraceae bacterium]